MARKLVLSKESLVLTQEIDGFIQKKVTPSEQAPKLTAPKSTSDAPFT
jgi:hypothetical protein